VQAVCANGDALARLENFLGDHAIELPIGLDTELFTPGPTSLRTLLGWTEQHFVIGYVGRLTRLKGVDLLASAFHELAKTAPDARLLIIGSGHEEGNIRSILEKELATGVAYIKPDVSHEHLSQWYRAMDLIVMPSRYENFSNALVEAMACSVPFLASDIGGNRMLAEGGAGWLFEPNSISSLSEQLRGVVQDRAVVKAPGEIGARYVREHYSWAVSAERLESILNRICG
jgi:glycosyltransferase involved in cell wall biosynthesis